MEKYALILEPSDFSMCPCYMKMKALDLQGWSQLQSTFKFILHVFPSSSYFRNKFVSSFWPSFLFFFRSYILPCFICLNIFSVKPKFQTSTKPSNPIIQMWRNGNALAEFFREFFLVERAWVLGELESPGRVRESGIEAKGHWDVNIFCAAITTCSLRGLSSIFFCNKICSCVYK